MAERFQSGPVWRPGARQASPNRRAAVTSGPDSTFQRPGSPHDHAGPACAARARCVELLNAVGIADAQRRLDEYPFQLSGGMKQRVMIAMSLLCEPRLLIADEPTTALDVTIQAQILQLIKGLQAEMGMALIMITHDLGVIAETVDRVSRVSQVLALVFGPDRPDRDEPRPAPRSGTGSAALPPPAFPGWAAHRSCRTAASQPSP